ncbi:MAG: hypothetical protein J6D29_02835 [Solobacterium sp.]|nr:hypothetical protein [Solobacterium sp.]
MKIEITWKGGGCTKEYDEPITVLEIVEEFKGEYPRDIMACYIDHEINRLDAVIEKDCKLDLLDVTTKSAYKIYQSSLQMLYIKAVHDVLGEDVHVSIDNALSKGIYTTIRTGGITKNTAARIEHRMHELVEMKLPFQLRTVSRKEAIAILNERNLVSKVRVIENLPEVDNFEIYSLGKEWEVTANKLVLNTSQLKHFEVRRYKNGMLLRTALPSHPDGIPPYEEQKQLYSIFAEESRWDRIMGVHYASDLNDRMIRNDYKDLVLLSEALHEKRISEIATEITKQKKRIILIAGPSSSGKTTFSNRLMIQMRVNGLRPLYLGTDDYFVNREDTPIGPDGEKNFEDLEAIDVKLFDQQMNDLLAGKKVDIPTFDFIEGKKIFGTRITSIDASQPIVIEGIHGLNPALTKLIDDAEKYKIYISPLTQLNIDEHNRISTTDARMLRRVVRDHQFRGRNPRQTINEWRKVRDGEDKNIFPYNEQADTFFNSHCLYELAVLKKYATPLLEEIRQEEKEYPEAQRMLKFLSFFVEMPDDSIIPNNSIMREFIGGSILA